MAKETLYTYTVVHYPSGDKKKAKVVVEPTNVLATNADVARTKAILAVPEEYREAVEELEVTVRPF